MPVFVYTEQHQDHFTTQSIEAVSYAKHIANLKETELIAICINANDTHILQKYGVNKAINIKSETLKVFNAQLYAKALAQNANDGFIIFPHTSENAVVAASLSILKESFLITQALSVPEKTEPFSIRKKSFSGKVTMNITTEEPNIILTLSPHSFGIQENFSDSFCEVEFQFEDETPFQIVNTEEETEKKDLTTSDIVVCAGRGLQAPENWQMIEDLAAVLGGATACTRPISDMGWRDYNEHAGQTGKTIAPRLYIGIGISGAIQHIAGINASQCIVVINNDPEAEFFKYADYGIISDAFEVVPKLIEKIRLLRESHHTIK